MSATTRIVSLRPMDRQRADRLASMFRSVQNQPTQGLALDRDGRVTSVVDADSPDTFAILGDFDVHA